MKTTLLIFLVTITSAFAGSRDVAVLWDSSEVDQKSHTYSFVFQKFEVVLNHYGYKLKYFDVNQKRFKAAQVNPEKFYGLVTWFIDDEVLNLDEVREVYDKWFKSGQKVLSLGELGIFYDKNQNGYELAKVNEILRTVGLKYEDHQYKTALGLKVKKMAPKEIIEFERELLNETPAVKVFSNLSSNNKVLIEVSSLVDKRKSTPVIYNDSFFMVHSGFDIFYNPVLKYSQWRINPFFMAKWFVGESRRIFPDTTTVNGNRIFYAHIDGDAFINVSDVDRKSISGKIILDKIIDKYPLPITVSFIVAELDQKYLGKPGFLKVAKEIASRENVELATHTYFHPLSWEKKPDVYEVNAYLDKPETYKGGPIIAYPPRDNKLDYNREIVTSLKYINEKIAPENKQTKFVLWSGSCEPPVEAMKVIKENKLINMNGGDSRFDRDYPSYSHLYPLYRNVDGMIQVHSSNSNEIPYTDNWKSPFSGQLKLLETFDNTDRPIRIKPMNIYYHFYSGEKRSSLNSLFKIYDSVLSQNVFPIFTSDYAKLVESYVDLSYQKTSENIFQIKNSKALKTFRIDEKDIYPDYKLSENVIGHKLINDSLYIFLGPRLDSTIVLTKKEPATVYLSQSNVTFSIFSPSPDSLHLVGKTLAKNAEIEVHTGKKNIVENSAFKMVKVGENTKLVFQNQSVDIILRFSK